MSPPPHPLCLFRVRLNSLPSLWYCLLTALLQAWMLWLAFHRYRLYTEMQWPAGHFPRLWLTAYVSLLAACLPLLALFFACGILRSGNLAGDGDPLGARQGRPIQLLKGGQGQAARRRRTNGYRLCHCLLSLWVHGPPPAQSLHLLLALVQLFAQQIMLAQLYRSGFINSGDFLNSELDFLFQRARQLATNLPMGETRLQSFRLGSEELSGSPLAPNLLPILMHARLFGIPLELANLLLALVALCAVYPAVFWRANKCFAFCFSLFLVAHCGNMLWTYLGFALLFRIQETNFNSARPVGIGQHLWALRSLPLFHPLALVIAFWLCLGLAQLAPVTMYAFGYGKFVASQCRIVSSNGRRTKSSVDGAVEDGNGEGDWDRQQRQMVCDGYATHVSAIALLLALAAAKAPAFYAIGVLYQREEKPFLLCYLLTDLFYLFCWILLWLLFTLKFNWSFRVRHTVQQLICLQDAHKIADGMAGERLGRSPAELKNALLLVHGENMFLTDDPVAKPAIMRQVLRSCNSSSHQQQQLEEGLLPYWMRQIGSSQSPPQRRIFHHQQQQHLPPAHEGIMMAAAAYQQQNQHNQQPMAMALTDGGGRQHQHSPPMVPLAQPPYQRMGSLPPQPQQQPQQYQYYGGTLIRSARGALPVAMAPPNDYGSFVRGQLQQQQQFHAPQPPSFHQPQQQNGVNSSGTLSRSHYGSQQQQQYLANHQGQRAESYATIQRRTSKSSVCSSSTAAGGQAMTAAGVIFPSPQLVRGTKNRASGGRGEGEARDTAGGGMAMAGGMMPLGLGLSTNGQSMNCSPAQAQQQSTGSSSLLLLNGGIQSAGEQRRTSNNNTANIPNGSSSSSTNNRARPALVLMAPAQQQSGSTFGAAGVWQQETAADVPSLNGTTPSGSLTVDSSNSRVDSSASNASQATAATFEMPAAAAAHHYFNTNGSNGGQHYCDGGTLTSSSHNKYGSGGGRRRTTTAEQTTTTGEWKVGGQLTVGKGGAQQQQQNGEGGGAGAGGQPMPTAGPRIASSVV